ncbi:hypothetical protein ACQVP2_28495 [Methylobacterium aquaticum]|uniref:hypothetical protein n=1 Tax=Methylobacterium aquaticum TaxID=270351 RepID=UPI003D166AD1
MQTYAYLIDGVVVERIDVPDGLVPGVDLYTPQFAGALVACGPSVRPGDLYDAGTRAFAPAPAPPAGPVPDVTSAQAKIALIRAGHMPAVRTAVAQASEEVQVWFSDAQTWQRTNPYVAAIGAGLGLTDTAIDALFRDAAAIQA